MPNRREGDMGLRKYVKYLAPLISSAIVIGFISQAGSLIWDSKDGEVQYRSDHAVKHNVIDKTVVELKTNQRIMIRTLERIEDKL